MGNPWSSNESTVQPLSRQRENKIGVQELKEKIGKAQERYNGDYSSALTEIFVKVKTNNNEEYLGAFCTTKKPKNRKFGNAFSTATRIRVKFDSNDGLKNLDEVKKDIQRWYLQRPDNDLFIEFYVKQNKDISTRKNGNPPSGGAVDDIKLGYIDGGDVYEPYIVKPIDKQNSFYTVRLKLSTTKPGETEEEEESGVWGGYTGLFYGKPTKRQRSVSGDNIIYVQYGWGGVKGCVGDQNSKNENADGNPKLNWGCMFCQRWRLAEDFVTKYNEEIKDPANKIPNDADNEEKNAISLAKKILNRKRDEIFTGRRLTGEKTKDFAKQYTNTLCYPTLLATEYIFSLFIAVDSDPFYYSTKYNTQLKGDALFLATFAALRD